MQFNGFSQEDFDTFRIEGLAERMEAIEERIRPKFRELGGELTDDLSAILGQEMHLHIAKHARRTVNPPKDTWLAIAGDKRGYKKHPHFQVGLFDDRAFIWLAFIYELPDKANIAQRFLDRIDTVEATIPDGYVISQDHMKKGADPVTGIDLDAVLERFRTVKKAELLIGRTIPAGDPLLDDGEAFYRLANETFNTLVPLYRMVYS
ncbi:hypothetical protein C772_00666 [Bhargavaea cecembensis DSE10]|uniref:UPF0637 protein C772_00666 n=1 Tax=Bhargavaea cecembensis DSE10 TaxID=1235279 RepID=M7P165_9BACL|nr:DUF1054 domain-containing protein [Bhargavaea cecembensis]EMR07650.1 hypothetical protein C772_00666 [Bhargavaea cecembensis DSE10]